MNGRISPTPVLNSLVGILICAGVASGAYDERGAEHRQNTAWGAELSFAWVATLPTVSSAPAAILTASVCSGLQTHVGEKNVCPSCAPFAADADGDAADLVIRSIQAGASVTGCLPADSLEASNTRANGNGTISLASGDIVAEGVSGVEKFWQTCFGNEYCITLNPCTGITAGTVEWVFAAPVGTGFDLEVDVSVDVYLEQWAISPCMGGRSLNNGKVDAGVRGAIMVVALNSSDQVVAEWSDEGTVETTDGDTVDQTGLFAGEDFVQSGSGGLITVAGVSTLTYAIPVNTKKIMFTFSAFTRGDRMGDFDGDGKVCWTARDILRTGWQSSAGDLEYDPRVDFDFNGTLDVGDLGVLNTIPCSADFNCDGTVDFFDYQGFQNAYSVQAEDGDINYDGNWDFFDIQMYLNAFAAGCGG